MHQVAQLANSEAVDDLLHTRHEHLMDLLGASLRVDEGPTQFLDVHRAEAGNLLHDLRLDVAEHEWRAEARDGKATGATGHLVDLHLLEPLHEQRLHLDEEPRELTGNLTESL